MIDSYVTKSYFIDRKRERVKSNKVVSNSVLGERGNIEVPENTILSCEEVCSILKVRKEKDDKEW